MFVFLTILFYLLGAFLGYEYTKMVDNNAARFTKLIFAAFWFVMAFIAIYETILEKIVIYRQQNAK